MNTCRFFGACKTTAAGYFLMTFVYTSKARSATHLCKEQMQSRTWSLAGLIRMGLGRNTGREALTRLVLSRYGAHLHQRLCAAM